MAICKYLCFLVFFSGIIHGSEQRTTSNFIPELITPQSDLIAPVSADVDVIFLSAKEGDRQTFSDQPLLFVAGQHLLLIPTEQINDQMRIEMAENEFNLEPNTPIIKRKDCITKGLNAIEVARVFSSIFKLNSLSENETVYLSELVLYNIDIEFISNNEGVPPLTPPFIQTPRPGSVLQASTVNFVFNANGNTVERYWFSLGTSAGVWDLFYGPVESNVSSVQVGGLPTNGGTIYGMLAYKINGVWYGELVEWVEWTSNTKTSSWDFDVKNLKVTNGGTLGTVSLLPDPSPVLWMGYSLSSTMTGNTALPHPDQWIDDTIWMEVFWVTTSGDGCISLEAYGVAADSGDEIQNIRRSIYSKVPVNNWSPTRLYKSVFAFSDIAQKDFLAFVLKRTERPGCGGHQGNIGILGIRFVYASPN